MRTLFRSIFLLLFLQLAHFQAFSQAPKSVFSHIEIILDSAAFEQLVANAFVWEQLATCTYDTMLTSPLVLSYYLNGKADFMHFNPSRGYFATQRGTAYLIFQSLRPGQGKLLEAQWRKVAPDSLTGYDFTGPDFTLHEIVYTHHDRLRKKPHNNLIPMLSSYSVSSYRNWGLGDSAEVTVAQFLAHDAVPAKRLYNQITSLELTMNQKEFTDLLPVLQLVGYKKVKNTFRMPGQPTISCTVSEQVHRYKVSKAVLSLTEDAGIREFDFGSAKLRVQHRTAEFRFE